MSGRGSSRSRACVIATWPAGSPSESASSAQVDGRSRPSRIFGASSAGGGGSKDGPAQARKEANPSWTVSASVSASSDFGPAELEHAPDDARWAP